MTEPTPGTPRSNYLISAGAMAGGAYFFAVGARLLPIPGGPANLHGPLWLVLCIGLAFFFAGVAGFIQIIGHANETGDFPAGTPRWMSAAQYLIGLAIFVCFGLIASWVAFGPGGRHFSGTIIFGDAAANAAIGRTVFGLGAVIVWLATAAFAAFGFRKFFDRDRSSAG